MVITQIISNIQTISLLKFHYLSFYVEPDKINKIISGINTFYYRKKKTILTRDHRSKIATPQHL